MEFKIIAIALLVFWFCLRIQNFSEASNTWKNHVKAVQIDEGKVIDCVDIYSQPSLDHPLLKNHKVQLRPSAFPLDKFVSDKQSGWSRKESCPDGTVPIYRTTEDEKIIAKKLSKQMFRSTRRNLNSPPIPSNDHEIMIKMINSGYYGAVGTTSVYGLNITKPQSSSSNIWIEGGPDNEFNYIVAGSMISPSIFGDNNLRIFVFWSADGGKKTGCVNLLCKGFVQINPKIGPSTAIAPLSIIGGTTYEMKFLVYQDAVTGNWWFVVSDQNVVVGYWPKEILPHLGAGASDIGWGGVSMGGNDGISPPMGSGRYPDGFYDAAAFFRQIKFVNKSLVQISPQYDDPNIQQIVVDTSRCFKLQNDQLTTSDYWGYRFSFGGPGGTTCKH